MVFVNFSTVSLALKTVFAIMMKYLHETALMEVMLLGFLIPLIITVS